MEKQNGKYISTFRQFAILSPKEFEKYLSARKNSPYTETFDFSIHGEQSFLFLDPSLTNLLVDLAEKDGTLNAELNALPLEAKQAFYRHSLCEEILATNSLENIHSTQKEVQDALLEAKSSSNSKIISIAKGYDSLLSENKPSFPTSNEEVRQIYDSVILQSIEKENYPDGKLYRAKGVSITDGVKEYHKPPYGEATLQANIATALSICQEKSIPVFIRAAIFHFIYEYTHPFYDGNGRLGRYLLSLFFLTEGKLSSCFCLSPAIFRKKARYYKAFEETEDVRNHGDLSTFVYPFLSLLKEGIDHNLAYIEESKAKMASLQSQIEKNGSLSSRDKEVLIVLIPPSVFSFNGYSSTELAVKLGKGKATIDRALSSLSRAGLLKKEKISKSIYYSLNEDAFRL